MKKSGGKILLISDCRQRGRESEVRSARAALRGSAQIQKPWEIKAFELCLGGLCLPSRLNIPAWRRLSSSWIRRKNPP